MMNNDNLTLDDAQKFNRHLQKTLPVETYKKYCELLDGFMKLEIGLQGFVDGAMELMKENETLVQDFQKFLPSSSDSRSPTTSSVTASPAAVEQPVIKKKKKKQQTFLQKRRIWEITDDKERNVVCHKFVDRVRAKADPEAFDVFLDIIIDFQKHKDIDRLNSEACELFRSQPELHIEFSVFLADAYEEKDRKKSIVMANKTLSNELKIPDFLVKWNMEKVKEKDCENSEAPAKKKQRRALILPPDEEEEEMHLSESSLKKKEETVFEEMAEFKHLLENISVKKEREKVEEEQVQYSSELPLEKKRGLDDMQALAQEFVSTEVENPVCRAIKYEKESNIVSTDLVLSVPVCKIGVY